MVISTGDVNVLKGIKGIGTKTAQRIIVDLKDKIDKGEISLEKIGVSHNTVKEEALSGLVVLGFNKKAVEKAIDKILVDYSKEEGDITVEGVIKEALKIL
jgi:Holliday junction DNA helicase RuvA